MQFAWEDLPDSDILKMRICDLHVRIHGSELEERVQQLYHELEARGLPFRRIATWATNGFHPRDRRSLPSRSISHIRGSNSSSFIRCWKVEGGTSEWCMQILRHECGHAYDHAYQFSSTRAWVRVFGNREVEYEP
jgi:hypothetical protein